MYIFLYMYIMCTPTISAGGIEPSTKSSKRWALQDLNVSKGAPGKERGEFFKWQGEVCGFHIKNKLKSEIFNDEKSL